MSLRSFPSFDFAEGYQISFLSFNTPPFCNKAFHWLAVSFDFLTGRQASPFPSIVPFPVIAILTAPLALIGDWHLRVSNPSKDVCTIGYKSKSSLNKIIAPPWRYI